MVQPINYKLNVQDPFTGVLQGAQMGSAIAANREKRELAEAQKAQQEIFQSDVAALFAKENPSARDYAQLTLKHPQFNEQFQQSWNMLNEEQKTSKITQISDIYAALEAKKPDVAQNQLENQAVALENSGDEKSAKAARTLKRMIELSPETAKASVALRLSAMMGPDKFTETFTKLQTDRRLSDLENANLTKAESEALKVATEAKFAEAAATQDLIKQGWDITKLQNDVKIKKENLKLSILDRDLEKEKNDLKRQELEMKKQELQKKRNTIIQQKAAEVESGRFAIDNMLNTTDRILQTPIDVIKDATGVFDRSIVGRAIDVFDQDVANFNALIENLDAQAFLAQVPNLVGMGSLSDAEGKKIAAALQNLSLKQGDEQLIFNIQEVQRLLLKSRKNLVLKYGVPENIPDTPAAKPSAEDIDALVKKYTE